MSDPEHPSARPSRRRKTLEQIGQDWDARMQVARSEGHGAGQPASAEPEPIGTAVGIVGIQLPFWEVALLVLQVTICQALLAGVALLVLRYLDVI